MIKHLLLIVPSLLTLVSTFLNLVLVGLLALPFMLVWNWTVVPLGMLPAIGYGRSCGLLMLWLILRIAGEGGRISAKTRSLNKST
jgi:hypothetical protein